MSRIGQAPVPIPNDVVVEINGGLVSAKGKLGELSVAVTEDVSVKKDEKSIMVSPASQATKAKQMWGTSRAVINNLIVGVSEGFKKELEVNGTGYRAQLEGGTLILQLGFSHDVRFQVPEGIKINCPDQTHIEIFGIDKQKVGQVAADIRRFRPPEPYKGKGVKYSDEHILRKEGKKK